MKDTFSRNHRLKNCSSMLHPPIRYTNGLPILERKDTIVQAIRQSQIVVIAGETGSGKTTQLPVLCLDAGRGRTGKIGCTQPRRIAAVSVANRVAQELKVSLGQEVGYKIRFSDHDSPQTSVKFMTDGILLTEIERDPDLNMYDTLIIDEAHERSLNIDFILGYLRKLLRRRPDLKLIISSATIDTELFSQSFGNAPVIEVSGRVFPVEVLYLDAEEEEQEGSYVDAAMRAVKDLIELYHSGDMLVFMPSERDIRETCDRLRSLFRSQLIVLPLFSRLSRSEQERIFLPAELRKVVVATNIAETSITVPGIRFVVDTGLARISQYAPRLRTNRLPIEPISRAAAEQRKGRCGRVMDGICVRLYSEANFLSRDEFTLPEIKRANLAGVILSMIAHGLGDISEFPFLEPPNRTAIAEGYVQLRELGAIDAQNRLTSLGSEMARLTLDPHIARMVLAARHEGALREIKIIASGLSIVDPRERPFEKQAEADTMHRTFTVPGSDFLTYVRLWDRFQDEWQTLKTLNKMRKFCKDHYLSFSRMREWHDMHQMLSEILSRMKGFTEKDHPSSPDAVHRSLLTGLLSNSAQRNEHGRFRTARGREVLLFPGSSLAGQKPDWIMCHEIVETSQVFARTVAPINPKWLEELAPHLCSKSYSEPWFDKDTGVVRATEKVSFYGLQVAEHSAISFMRVNPQRATEVFVWEGLVEEQLQGHYNFFHHNKNLKKEIELIESKLRSRSFFAGEQAMAEFYLARLSNVGSIHDLNRVIKEQGSDSFLCMQKDDLLAMPIPDEGSRFPDSVSIGGKMFSLQYAFAPGAEHDGVTLKVAASDAAFIPENLFGWMVPALWPGRIREMLRSLPKELRKKFIPVSRYADELAQQLQVSAEPFEVSLVRAIRKLYALEIDPSLFSTGEALPEHLQMRIEIHDKNGTVVASGRDAAVLNMARQDEDDPEVHWQEAFKRHEKTGLREWTCGAIPDHVEVVSSKNGVPLYGYPALKSSADSVDLILCCSPEKAQKTHLQGVKKLLEITLTQEFAWVEREVRFSQQLKLLCASLGGADRIRELLLCSLREHLLTLNTDIPRSKEQFDAIAEKVRSVSRGIGYEAVRLLETALSLYADNSRALKKDIPARLSGVKDELAKDLDRYIEEIRTGIRFSRLQQFPRYLRAFGYRISRAALDPAKYTLRRSQLHMYREMYEALGENVHKDDKPQKLELLEGMIEEFAISLFAQQEIKTLFPISCQRLEKKIKEIEKKQGQ